MIFALFHKVKRREYLRSPDEEEVPAEAGRKFMRNQPRPLGAFPKRVLLFQLQYMKIRQVRIDTRLILPGLLIVIQILIVQVVVPPGIQVNMVGYYKFPS